MATISGRLIYDGNRTTIASPTFPGISNVPIILQNTATGNLLAVLTDTNGNYSFINVPNGNYQIVEYYGASGAIASPGDFTNAIAGALIAGGIVPPISYIANPPIGATNLDCTTPNTLLITVTDANLSNLNILNGPVKYTAITEIMDHNVVVSTDNLINIAEDGTFGTYAPGTPSYTFADSSYSGIGEGFNFVQTIPRDGSYAIENITHPQASGNTWWSFADHSQGNETGRMMVINGDNPGALIFNDTVIVKPDTYYLFSAWILNMIKFTGFQAPAFSVKVIDSSGKVLIDHELGQDIPPNLREPEWVQIGSIIYTESNTSLTIQFISQGPAARGNDYALDDVSFYEVTVPDALPLHKAINTEKALVGDIVTYTITLTNTYDFTMNKISFKDVVPDGLIFVPGSVKVNDVIYPTANPNDGFDLPDLESGKTLTIQFAAQVNEVPDPNPTINAAEMSYDYAFIKGGIPNSYEIISNEVPLLVDEQADLAIIKTAVNTSVKINDILTYVLTITNYGPNEAKNIIVTDRVPAELSNLEYSIDGGLTWHAWNGFYRFDTLAKGASLIILIRGVVKALTGAIKNTAIVKSDTLDPNPENNHSTIETVITANADVSVIKTACPNEVMPCDLITYTIIVSNAGPNQAENVVLIDEISKKIYDIEYSLDNGKTWHRWRNKALQLGDLAANTHVTILIRGTVCACACGEIKNKVLVTSQTHDENHNNNNEYKVITPIKRRCCQDRDCCSN